MNYPKTLKDKKYPPFIRNSSFIKSCKSITKKFEDSGISDFSKKYTHKPTITLAQFVIDLKKVLGKAADDYSNYDNSRREVAGERLKKLIKKIKSSSIKKNNKLVLPDRISLWNGYDYCTYTYTKNSSLITLIANLYEDLMECGYNIDLEDKTYNLLNNAISLELSFIKTLKIVFSSKSWDIATMSMRGIKSCQAWNKTQKTCLIGSILDPYATVIYLTDGKQHKKYGDRMIARSVVRIASPICKYDPKYNTVSEKEKKLRVVYVENAYSSFSESHDEYKLFQDIFKSAILEQASKSPLYSDTLTTKNNYICRIPLTAEVAKLPDNYRSYRDSGMGYSATIN